MVDDDGMKWWNDESGRKDKPEKTHAHDVCPPQSPTMSRDRTYDPLIY